MSRFKKEFIECYTREVLIETKFGTQYSPVIVRKDETTTLHTENKHAEFKFAVETFTKRPWTASEWEAIPHSINEYEARCICSHPIQYLYLIRHKPTGLYFQVGSECVKYADQALYIQLQGRECANCPEATNRTTIYGDVGYCSKECYSALPEHWTKCEVCKTDCLIPPKGKPITCCKHKLDNHVIRFGKYKGEKTFRELFIKHRDYCQYIMGLTTIKGKTVRTFYDYLVDHGMTRDDTDDEESSESDEEDYEEPDIGKSKITFGKYSGKTFEDVFNMDIGYCTHMLSLKPVPYTRDFIQYVKAAMEDDLDLSSQMITNPASKHYGKTFLYILENEASYCRYILGLATTENTQIYFLKLFIKANMN